MTAQVFFNNLLVRNGEMRLGGSLALPTPSYLSVLMGNRG